MGKTACADKTGPSGLRIDVSSQASIEALSAGQHVQYQLSKLGYLEGKWGALEITCSVAWIAAAAAGAIHASRPFKIFNRPKRGRGSSLLDPIVWVLPSCRLRMPLNVAIQSIHPCVLKCHTWGGGAHAFDLPRCAKDQ